MEYNDHPPVLPETWLTWESNLIPDQMEFIQQLYTHGVLASTISEIISKIVGIDFDSTTISNGTMLNAYNDSKYGLL